MLTPRRIPAGSGAREVALDTGLLLRARRTRRREEAAARPVVHVSVAAGRRDPRVVLSEVRDPRGPNDVLADFERDADRVALHPPPPKSTTSESADITSRATCSAI